MMNVYWSQEIDVILSAGHSLEDIGVRIYALCREHVLSVLAKTAEIGVAILGGDVYRLNNGIIEPNYDSWYCNHADGESASAFVDRSIAVARNYIANYKAPEGIVLFAIVPEI